MITVRFDPSVYTVVHKKPTDKMQDVGVDAHYEAENRAFLPEAWKPGGFAKRSVRASYVFEEMLNASSAMEEVILTEEDAKNEWRQLAIQFDNHRMQALWHLKAMIADPEKHSAAAVEFLSRSPNEKDPNESCFKMKPTYKFMIAHCAGDLMPSTLVYTVKECERLVEEAIAEKHELQTTPIGYVHPQAMQRLQTGNAVSVRKNQYDSEEIPVFVSAQPDHTKVLELALKTLKMYEVPILELGMNFIHGYEAINAIQKAIK